MSAAAAVAAATPKQTRAALIAACKEHGLRGYSGKSREELEAMLAAGPGTATATAAPEPLRLNYIGSKYQLLEWLDAEIRARTGWESFAGKRIADLFAGTGSVSWHFRKAGATVIANDPETYSAVITSALVSGIYTPELRDMISALNAELDANSHAAETGYITEHYSPATGGERQFFTVDNARRIDYVRRRIEELTLSLIDRNFLIASLLLAADAVSNVPAVYGCYLKTFKARALKPLTLRPVHERTIPPIAGSQVLREDVSRLSLIDADAVYLDPPYNERQYSKNYFPLNVIVRGGAGMTTDGITLSGKTGIPSDCFLSPFCRRKEVAGAFDRLVAGLRAPWIFLSYSSEGLVSKADMITLLSKYGEVTVAERTYKRFKSFEYNETGDVQEYLFCLHKSSSATSTA